MIQTKLHTYLTKKLASVFEADASDKKKKSKGEPTIKYKENISIREIPGGESAFKSYMAMFTEALNCLDSIYALAQAADPENKEVKDFNSQRKNIGVNAGKTEDGVNSAWKKLSQVAAGLLNVIPQSIKKNDVVKKYQEEKAKLDAEFKDQSGKKMKEDYYRSKLQELQEKYSAMIDQGQIISMTKLSQASKLYFTALQNFYRGSQVEVEFIKNKSKGSEEVSEEFFKKAGSAMESFVLSKKFADNFKVEESIVLEGLVQGLKSILGKSKDEPAGDTDTTNLKYVSDNLLGRLISLAHEIDNVIAYKSTVQGRETNAGRKSAEEAKVSAGEMIKFVRDSVEYINGNKENKSVEELLVDNKTPHSEIRDKLDKISNEAIRITRNEGPLQKWKTQVLGEKREKTASGAYLERGRELMSQASEITKDVVKSSQLNKELKKTEPDELVKRAIKAFRGQDSDSEKTKKPSRIKKRSDYKSFSDKPKPEDKEAIKDFQDRLVKLGSLPSGYKEGEYDQKTQEAAKKTMSHLGLITGKVYDTTGDAFKDFTVDVQLYGDKLDDIRNIVNK
jgi:hypothetical protein